MPSIEDNISVFVESQFPRFYHEEGEDFVAFVKAYYEWMESDTGPLKTTRNLLEYQDVDTTIVAFLDHFKRTFLNGFPLNTEVNTRLLIKNILDMYQSKGSPRSVELLFRLLFNEDVSVYYPGSDVFTTSDSDYYRPIYIEVVSVNTAYLISLEGKEITGSITGAKAFVESVVTKMTNQKVIHVLYLSNVRGCFERDELVSHDGILDDAPLVVGSLSGIDVTLGGANNSVGDTFTVVSEVGKQGRARVTSVEDGTGRVAFTLLDGGWGFSTNSNLTEIKINDAYVFVNNAIQTMIPHEWHDYANWTVIAGTGSVTNNGDGTWLFDDTDSTANEFRIGPPDALISVPADYEQYAVNIKFRRGTHDHTTFFFNTDGVEKEAEIDWSSNTVTTDTITSPVGTEDLSLTYEWSNNGNDVELNWVLSNDGATVTSMGFRLYDSTTGTGNFTIVGPLVVRKLSEDGFQRFEQLIQPIETVAYISGTDVTDNYTVGDWIEGIAPDGTTPIANGVLVSATTDGANGVLTICATEGTFGNQQTLVFSSNTGPFQDGERVLEGNVVNLPWTSKTGTISVSDSVTGDTSGAEGVVSVSNSTVIQVDDSFGEFEDGEQVSVDGSNYFTADSVSVQNSGANAVITGIINSTAVSISDQVGTFDAGREMRGQRTSASATIGSTTETGVAYLFLNGTSTQNAVPSDITISSTDYDAFTNNFVTGNLIGFDSESVGVWGNNISFINSTYAHVYGSVTNTHANVVSVGTGSGADFNIGTLGDEEALTVYTDFISDNNSANVAFLDVVVDGSNAGIGFVSSFDITAGGSGYVNGQSISFTGGGIAGGPPTTAATATVNTDGAGALTSITVTSGGTGYYNAPGYTVPTGTGATSDIVMDFGYGFGKSLNGDLDTVIDDCLTNISGNVGTIALLSEVNPGAGYNADPHTAVYTRAIAKYDRRDMIISIGSLVSNFSVGERLTQQVNVPGIQLTLEDVQNSTPSTVPLSSAFSIGEGIKQVVNSTVTIWGTVLSFDDTDKMTVNNVRRVNTATWPYLFTTTGVTFNTTDDIEGVADQSTANVTAETSNDNLVDAKGRITSANSTTLGVERLSFLVNFGTGTLQGESSGATATLISVSDDANTRPIGDNATITANVETATGIVTGMEVIDSGYGYENSANLSLIPEDSNNVFVVSGTANVNNQGVGEGFWRDTKSTTSVDKYLHDNDYYQEYSYQVRSPLSVDRYAEIMKRVLHVAGTKQFGQVIAACRGTMVMDVSNSHILVTYANSDTQIYTDSGAET